MMDRLLIYEGALELALSSPLFKKYPYKGICHYLTDAIFQIYHDTTYNIEYFHNDSRLFEQTFRYVECGVYGASDAFPEIARHVPEDFDIERQEYWFHGDNAYEKHIAILRQAIEETKEDYARKEEFDADHYDGGPCYE